MARERHCPRCRSWDIIPIQYGFPSQEMVARYERGEIELGGCCIIGNEPEWRCRSCGEAFRSERGGG